MRVAIVLSILRKELKETLRDRRTLLMMIGLPVLVYPLLMVGLSRLQESQTEASEARASSIAIWGTAPASLAAHLGEAGHLQTLPWAAPWVLSNRSRPGPCPARPPRNTKFSPGFNTGYSRNGRNWPRYPCI